MAGKFGADFASDMLDRGRREIGGALYADSNVAQPMYPLRSGFEPPKEAESPTMEQDHGSVLESRLPEAEASRETPGRDNKDLDKE